MRSIKKTLLLATAAIVAVAFAVPAVASASNWTKEGSEMKGVHWTQKGAALEGEGSLTLAGSLKLSGGVGTFSCPVSADATLFSPDSGVVTKIASTGACSLTGGTLKSLCKEVTGVTGTNLPWIVTATESEGKKVIKIDGAQLIYKFAGGGCDGMALTFKAKGSLTATPDNAGSINNVAMSGTMIYGSSEVGTSGTLNATPSGTFGISSAQTIAVAGTIGWMGNLGKMTCQAKGMIALEPGSNGRFTSLTVNECESSGWIGQCHLQSIAVLKLPGVEDQGSSIAIREASFQVGGAECGFTQPFLGDLTATPNNTSAISSTILNGTLTSGGAISIAWSGNLNWTPAGVYGL